jgi:hypothetical protein
MDSIVTADDHGWSLLDVGRCSDPLPFFSSRTSNAGDGISIGMLPGGLDCRQGRGMNCLKRCSSEPLNIVPTGKWQLLHCNVLLPSLPLPPSIPW